MFVKYLPLLIFLCIQVANFCNAEDDGSFWSRWIKPESVVTADVKVLSSIIIRPPSYVIFCLIKNRRLCYRLYRKLLHHGLLGIRRVMWIMIGANLTGPVKEKRKDLNLQIEVKSAEKLNILFPQLQY